MYDTRAAFGGGGRLIDWLLDYCSFNDLIFCFINKDPKSGRWSSVADLGFPRQGAPAQNVGVQTYYLANFPRKLHEHFLKKDRGARVLDLPI